MAQVAHPLLSYTEYLGVERDTGVRHEFLDGVIVAMAGGTIRHSRLKSRLLGMVHGQLEGEPCQPYDSDCKVIVEETELATYPDLSVVCGPPETHAKDPNAVVNPRLLAEVLSTGTEAWDRGGKFDHYRRITTLDHYVLLRVDVPRVEHFQRMGDGRWSLAVYDAGDVLVLDDLGLRLDVTTLYSDLPPVTDADRPRLPRPVTPTA